MQLARLNEISPTSTLPAEPIYPCRLSSPDSHVLRLTWPRSSTHGLLSSLSPCYSQQNGSSTSPLSSASRHIPPSSSHFGCTSSDRSHTTFRLPCLGWVWVWSGVVGIICGTSCSSVNSRAGAMQGAARGSPALGRVCGRGHS
jgi:hypothetical protein